MIDKAISYRKCCTKRFNNLLAKQARVSVVDSFFKTVLRGSKFFPGLFIGFWHLILFSQCIPKVGIENLESKLKMFNDELKVA